MRGQIISRLFHISSALVLLALAAVPAAAASAQRQQSTRSPHGPLNIPCENCHTATGWTPIRAVPEFNHDSTRYPLRGMHEKVSCNGCHLKPVFTDVGKNCADCHADIHRRQMGADCARCHTVNGWNVSVQAINNHFNRFPLLGAHAVVQCEDCHKGAAVGNYLGLSTACQSCHIKDFQNATSPNHVQSGFSTTCEGCHKSFDSWLNATFTMGPGGFDHASTGFPLTQGHANVACELCHIAGNYSLHIQLNDCGNSQCHLTDYNQTNSPPHASNPTTFPIAQCSTCHTPAGWLTAGVNHAAPPINFPLTQGHATVACEQCHISGNYHLQIALNDCGNSGCHLTTYNQTNAPPHAASPNSFPIAQCSTCHTTASWTAAFDHTVTGFPLNGMHVSPVPTPCISCHVNNNYNLTSAACITCHLPDWNSTATLGGAVPNHITANFPQDCSICHSTSNWTTSTFNHNATTFPLTGAHVSVACNLCHTAANSYSGNLPTDCYSCHITDWNSTATLGGSVPNHVASGYPTTCASCHTTTSWLGAVFNHNSTGFPLTGAHVNTACTLCHTSSAVPPTACSGCHMADWNSTQTLGSQVPNHVAAALISSSGFSLTACSTCHNTTAWTGAAFTHSWFNVNHGNAGGVCATCHIVAGDYSQFQCTVCHGNNNAANFHHPNVGGYAYNSVACYQCHSNGGGG
jgi:DUF971 family protein